MDIRGIINAHHAMAFAKFKLCPIFQIGSAVQDQDLTLIQG
jgi:hypothetical protein